MVQRDRCDRRPLEPLVIAGRVCCVLLLWTLQVSGLADFSGYLTKLLQNHTVSACDGDRLVLQCPRHSTISIHSAFYGRPMEGYPAGISVSQESMDNSDGKCMALTAFQKVLDECQNLRSCQLLVNSRVFGSDPCPGVTKYLRVSYKCKPTEYKTVTTCENTELKLHCKEPKRLNIYSAVYGRFAHEKNICPTESDRRTPFDCLSYAAVELLGPKCYGKQRCKMIVNDKTFGSPCLPGVTKHLTVNYSCDVKLDPRESRLPNREDILLSNLLAAFSYIRDHPESAALFFVSSVCIGLIFTLFALVIRISRRPGRHKAEKMNGHVLCNEDGADAADSTSDDEDDDDDDDTKSHFSMEFRELCRASHPSYNATDAADLAERIERREQIIQEIWMNSGLDLPPIRQTNPYF
ncbi:protein eva-1 homolog C isoform X2 [Spea bombifrons]|uniref:protein eva-1 homolog C isoform X2 n=1 Tax=Spea bombifrons TaxID=233779 RepID=UPI00234BF05D|nr:protein eva-1 homolog C isoform X2 [Spea bombifrons]